MLDLAAHRSNTGRLQATPAVLPEHQMSDCTITSALRPRQYLPAVGRIYRTVTGDGSSHGLGGALAGIGIAHRPVANAVDRSLTPTGKPIGMLAGNIGADGSNRSASPHRGPPT
jgi:hypothetical protein